MTREDKHIILDTITTKWICCDQEVLDIYNKCDGSRSISDLVRETSNETTAVIESLLDLGLVSVGPTTKAREPPDWPDKLELNIAVLKTTRRCNLGCRYCLANSTSYGEHMPLRVALKVIDRLLELPQQSIAIQWGGGEPLLNYRVIEEATKYTLRRAKENDKKVQFLIQTNGTLLYHHLKKLKEYGIRFGISLDGPPLINDQTRIFSDGTGSYRAVDKSIQKLDEPPSLLVTLSQANAPHIEEIINHFWKLGAQGLKINPCRPLGRATMDRSLCLDPLTFASYKIRAVEEVLRLRRNGLRMRIPANTQLIVRNFLNSYRKSANCYSSPSCGAGTRMLGFDVNGDVYPCDELDGITDYLCGNVFDQSLADIFSSSVVIRECRDRTTYNIPGCRKCMWRHFCGGGCTASAIWEYKDIMREDPFCEYRKKYFEYVLWKLAVSPSGLSLENPDPIL